MQGLLLGWGRKGDDNVQGRGIGDVLADWVESAIQEQFGEDNYWTLSTA